MPVPHRSRPHPAPPRAGLETVLHEASQLGLQQCQDYALFPLLMMLDAIAATRQAIGTQQAQQGEAAGATAVPAMSSDRAAEAALACMLCLLRRCACQSGDSLLGLLRRLAAVLELPVGSASEEIRQQALLCLGAVAGGAVKLQPPPGVREALLGEEAAPLLGYLSSLLLQVRLGGGAAAPAAAAERVPEMFDAVPG